MTWIWFSALLTPLLALAVDLVAHIFAWASPLRNGRPRAVVSPIPVDGALTEDDFTLVVPIYGQIKYLENVEWLDRYGLRVLLATSGSETDAFYRDLYDIADRHGFRVFVGGPARGDDSGVRSTGGMKRDTIVRDAHQVIHSTYVVCIDADTVTEKPVEALVGAFSHSGLDLGSVPLIVANTRTILGRLQALEYAMAMRLRRIMPWMVCGGCHIARRDVHSRLMAQHSLFFQGNDVELGLLAVERGLRVGHLDFRVPTVVPDTLWGWWRQRVAWAGGEFRITVVNIRLARHHPFLWVYGLVVVLLFAPLRWVAIGAADWVLPVVYASYVLAVLVVTRSFREPLLLVYPLYALVYTMVMLPFGGISYANQAIRSRNAGIIDSRSRRLGPRAAETEPVNEPACSVTG